MGCQSTKEERAEAYSVSGGGGAPKAADAPPPVDKRLPFENYRQIFTLKNYWKSISRSAEKSSKLLLQRYGRPQLLP